MRDKMEPQNTMTSRERLCAAVSHQNPDRVPIDLGGFQTGIHKRAYEGLLAYFGFDDEIVLLDPVQQLAKPSEEVLRRFRVDTRYVTAHAPDSFQGGIEQNWRNEKLWHDLRDEFGIVWSMPDDQQLYMDISHHPLSETSLAGISDYPFPVGSDPSRFTGLREEASRLRSETDFAICTGIGGVIYEFCWYLRGLENWFIDLIENPTLCEALLDKMLEYWKGFYTGFLGEAGDLVDVVMIGDDLAGQTGPLFNPQIYRDLVKPRHKALIRHIKSLTDAKVWYHTCGACSAYIPDLIDNGVDILNPVQIGTPDMDPSQLKERYGRQISFWGGGIDAQHVFPFVSPGEVREHVRTNLAMFKPGAGYVFNNVHNIQNGVPPENIEALFDAAYEFGVYDEVNL
jgi:uroporphyrinogen decarboxylase